MQTLQRDGSHELIRRRLLRFAFLLFALLFLPVPPSPRLPVAVAAGAERVTTATREGRLAVFDDVWATLGERYYDPHLNGVDWSAQRAALRPLAAEAQGQAEFYAVLRRLIGPLRDVHTRVYQPEERSEWQRPRLLDVGLAVREIEGEIVITRVERNAAAWRAGMRAGDAVLSVDGENVAARLARRLAEEGGASTAQAARLRALARLFDGPLHEPATVLVSATRGGEQRTRAALLPRVLRTREPLISVRREGGFAVVHFPLFTQEIVVELMRALERDELRKARGIIIDLRDNGGGEAEAMADMASAFLPEGIDLGHFTDRFGRVTSAPQTRRTLLLAATPINNFHGPLVILTSARTSSAAEIFVAALKEAGRATVIGETTCGCVLGIRRRHPLPDGGLLDISEMDFRTASDRRLEGAGVAPDEVSQPTRRDIREGRDPAIKRALEILKAQARSHRDT